MKKKLLVLLIGLTIILVGCSNEITTGQTTAVQTTLNQTTLNQTTTQINEFEEYGYEIEMLEYEDPYFDVTISNVEIDVLQRKINFHYEIDDFSTSYDYYFVYGYEGKSFRPFHNIPTNDRAASGDYTLDLLVDEIATSSYMTVEMGRYSDSVSVNREYPETNSAGFRYRINQFESRGYVEDYTLVFTRNDTDSYHIAEIDYLIIDDPSNTITSIKFVLSEASLDGYIVEERIIDMDNTNQDQDGEDIRGIEFTDLAPSVRYNVDVYISGNDGVYDFNELHLGRKQLEMEVGWSMVTYQHGFYCQILNSYQTGGITYINLDLANIGTYKVNNETPVLYLNYYHSSTDSEPYLSFELSNEPQNLQFTETSINVNDIVRVEDADRTVLLAETSVHTN